MEIPRSPLENGERILFVLIQLSLLVMIVHLPILLQLKSLLLKNAFLASLLSCLLPTSTTLGHDDSSMALLSQDSQDKNAYGDFLHSPCTLPVSCKSHASHSSFAKLYDSDLHGIEEEIIFPSSDDNEGYDDEDILLEIEPCITFATELFPHHDGTFLQALCEHVPSSLEMTPHNSGKYSINTCVF